MQVKRKFIRFNAPLRIKIVFGELNLEYTGIAKDISMGGIKVVIDKSINIFSEDTLSLFLLLPDRTLSVSGRIVWIKEYDDRKEAGICFSDLRDAYKDDIYNYIFKYYPTELNKKWWQM